jgi:hypothetical protein
MDIDWAETLVKDGRTNGSLAEQLAFLGLGRLWSSDSHPQGVKGRTLETVQGLVGE